MKVVVAHHSTELAAMSMVDRAADHLLAGTGTGKIQIVDQKKAWEGPVLSFSFTGKMGFISVPLAGTATVDDTNITVESELPSMIKNFVGEEKVRAMVEEKVRAIVA